MERSSDGAGTGSITHHPWPDFCSTVPCFAGPEEVKGERGLGQRADVFVFRPTDRAGNKLMSRPGFSGAADGKIRCVETLAREHRVRTGGEVGGTARPRPHCLLKFSEFRAVFSLRSALRPPYAAVRCTRVSCALLHSGRQAGKESSVRASADIRQRQGVRQFQVTSVSVLMQSGERHCSGTAGCCSGGQCPRVWCSS